MENNELVTQNTIKAEMTTQNQFTRVDFNNPSTILSYGSEVIEKIENYVSNATKDIENESIPDYEFYQRVDKLSGFQEKLDEVEERREKSDNKMFKLINFIASKIKGEKGESRFSYNQEYNNYVENVDKIVEDVQTLYENSKKDFELFNNFINSIKPYVGILEDVYQVGLIDKENYEKEVVELEQQYNEKPEDVELKRESVYKRQVLDIFDEKLFSIQKSQVSINQVIMQWNTRQINAMKMLTSYQNFLSLDKSIIKLNGTALVGAKKQKEEVNMLQYLMDGVNSALVESSKEQNDVISSVNELTKDGNIKTQTFTQVDQYIQQGIQLLKQGAIDKKANIETNTKALELIKQHFNEFNTQVKEQLLMDAYQETGLLNITTNSSKQKNKKKR